MFTTIANFFRSSKGFQVAMALIVLLVGGGSFALGRLSALDSAREPVRIEYPEKTGTAAVANAAPAVSPQKKKTSGMYVGSRSGTAYHLPWCPGAARIKDENKVWFDSKAEAEAAGYHPAGNCKGI